MSIIPYSEWGSRGQGGATIGPVGLVIVHHWYRPHIGANASRAREADALRGVESYHTDTNGWGGGTGYQFHAFGSGRKWEGRGWRRSGAHTVGKNGTSVAIALPIDGNAHEPTEAQTQAVADIIRKGVEQGHIKAGYRVRGHRDYSSKTCPGTQVSDAWLRDFEDLDRQAQPDPEDDMLYLWQGEAPDGHDGYWLVQFSLTDDGFKGRYTAVMPDELSTWQERAENDPQVRKSDKRAAPSWFADLKRV